MYEWECTTNVAFFALIQLLNSAIKTIWFKISNDKTLKVHITTKSGGVSPKSQGVYYLGLIIIGL